MTKAERRQERKLQFYLTAVQEMKENLEMQKLANRSFSKRTRFVEQGRETTKM
jgi:hypothetical protein